MNLWNSSHTGFFRRRVLFVCTHNSARNQMAEAFLNRFGGSCFDAESAGTDPGPIDPLAIKVMAEVGIDISGAQSKGVFELFKQGREYGYVITVCDEAARTCPIFPGSMRRIHWSFEDQASFEGLCEERLERTKRLRDEIKASVTVFVEDFERRTLPSSWNCGCLNERRGG